MKKNIILFANKNNFFFIKMVYCFFRKKYYISVIFTIFFNILLFCCIFFTTGCGNSGCRTAEEQYYKGIWEKSTTVQVKPLNNYVIQQESGVGAYILENGTTEALARENRWYRMQNERGNDLHVKAGQLVQLTARGHVILTGFSQDISLTMNDWVGLNGSNYSSPSGIWKTKKISKDATGVKPSEIKFTIRHNLDGSLKKDIVFTVTDTEGNKIEVPVYGSEEDKQKISIHDNKAAVGILTDVSNCTFDSKGNVNTCDMYIVSTTDSCKNIQNIENLNYMWYFVKEIRFTKWFDENRNIIDKNVVIKNPFCKAEGDSSNGIWIVCDFEYDGEKFQYRRKNIPYNNVNYSEFEEQVISKTYEPQLVEGTQGGIGSPLNASDSSCEDYTKDECKNKISTALNNSANATSNGVRRAEFIPESLLKHYVFCIVADGSGKQCGTFKSDLYNHVIVSNEYSPITVVFKTGDEIGLSKTKVLQKGQNTKYCRYLPKSITYNLHKYQKKFLWDEENEFCRTKCKDLCIQYFYDPKVPSYVTCSNNDCKFKQHSAINKTTSRETVDFDSIATEELEVKLNEQVFSLTQNNNETHRNNIASVCSKTSSDPFGKGWYGFYVRLSNDKEEKDIYYTAENQNFTIIKYDYFEKEKDKNLSITTTHKSPNNGKEGYYCQPCCTCSNYNCIYIGKYNKELQDFIIQKAEEEATAEAQRRGKSTPCYSSSGSTISTSIKPKLFNYTPFVDIVYDSNKFNGVDLKKGKFINDNEECPGKCQSMTYEDDGIFDEYTSEFKETAVCIDNRKSFVQNADLRRGGERSDSNNNTFHYVINNGETINIGSDYSDIRDGLLPILSPEIEEVECYSEDLPVDDSDLFVEYLFKSHNDDNIPSDCKVSGYYQKYETSNSITFNTDSAGILPIKWAGYTVRAGDRIPITISSPNPALIRKVGISSDSGDINDYMELKGGNGLMVYLEPIEDDEPNAAKYASPESWQCNMGVAGSYGYYRPYKLNRDNMKTNNSRQIYTWNNLWWICDDPVPMWFSGYDFTNVKTAKPINMHVYSIDWLKRLLPNYKPDDIEDQDTVEVVGCNENHLPTYMIVDGTTYYGKNMKIIYDNTEGALYKYRETENDAYKTIPVSSPLITLKEYSPFSPKIIQVTFKDNNDDSKIYENVTIKAVEYQQDEFGNYTNIIKNSFNELQRTYEKGSNGYTIQAYYEFNYSDGHHKIKVEDANVIGDASCYFTLFETKKTVSTSSLTNSFSDFEFKENDDYYVLNNNNIFTRFGPFIGMHEQTAGVLFPAIYKTHGMCRGGGDSDYVKQFIYDEDKVKITWYGVGGIDRKKVDQYWRIEFNTPYSENNAIPDGQTELVSTESRCIEDITWEPCSTQNLVTPDILIVDLSKTKNAITNPSLSGTVILYKDINNISLLAKKYYLITHKDTICDIDWKDYILDKEDVRISKIEKDGYTNVQDSETGIRIHLTIDGKECVIDDNEDDTSISSVQTRFVYSFMYKSSIYTIEQENISYNINAAICFTTHTNCNGYLQNYRTAGRFSIDSSYYTTTYDYELYLEWLFNKCYDTYGGLTNTQYMTNCIYRNEYSSNDFSAYCIKKNPEKQQKLNEENEDGIVNTTEETYDVYHLKPKTVAVSEYGYEEIDIKDYQERICENSRQYGLSKKNCENFILRNNITCRKTTKTLNINDIKNVYNLDKAPYMIACAYNSKERDKSFALPYSTKFLSDDTTNFTNKHDGLVLKSNIPSFIKSQYFSRCVADWHTPKWMLLQRPADPTSFYHGFDALSGSYIGNYTPEGIKKDYEKIWAGYGGMITNVAMKPYCSETRLSKDNEIKVPCVLESEKPFNASFKAVYPRQFILIKPIINDPLNTTDDKCNIYATSSGRNVASTSFSMNEPFSDVYPTAVLNGQITSKITDERCGPISNYETINGKVGKIKHNDADEDDEDDDEAKRDDSCNFFKKTEMIRNWIGAGVLRPYWHVLKDETGLSHIFKQGEEISFDTSGEYYVSGNLSSEDSAYCMKNNSAAMIGAETLYTSALAFETASLTNLGISIAQMFFLPESLATVLGTAAASLEMQLLSIAAMASGKAVAEDSPGGSSEKGKIVIERESYSKRKCGVGSAFRVIAIPPFACLTEYKYHCNNKRIDYKISSLSNSDSLGDICKSTGIPSWQTNYDQVGACYKQKIRISDNKLVSSVAQRYKNQDKKINSLIDSTLGEAGWDPLENVFQTQCGICAKVSSVYSYNGVYYYIDSEDPKELSSVKGLYTQEHCAEYTNDNDDIYAFYTNLTYIKPLSSYTSKQKNNIQQAILSPLKSKATGCDNNYQILSDLNNDKYNKMWSNAFLKAQTRNYPSGVSQLISLYSAIISEMNTTTECKEYLLEDTENISNIAFDSMVAIVNDISGDTYDYYSFEQNVLSASCTDDKRGVDSLGLEANENKLTTLKSITRFDQMNILSKEGYGELLSEYAIDDGNNSIILNIPTELKGKPFKRAKIGFAFAGVNNTDPMYLYKDYKRQNADDLDRGYNITLGSTAQVSNGKYLYFYIQPLNDQGLPDETYNPNTMFSPSKTEYGDDYYIAQNDMVYSFKDYDPDDDGVITFTAPRSGKLWLIILDSEELAKIDGDADGKIIEFATDENDGDTALQVDDTNVLATNSGFYSVDANVQTESLESITGESSKKGINTLITSLFVDNIKKLFLGEYKCEVKNGRNVCQYSWKDGILGNVALSFFKINLLYIAWFLLVLFVIIILSFQVLLGQKKLDAKFMKDYLLRYGLIMAFVNPNSLELYCRLFVNTSFNLAEGLSAYVAGAFNSSHYDVHSPNTFANVAFGPIDQILKFWIDKYTLEKLLAIIFSSWPGIVVVVILLICFIFFLINVIEAVILYIVILIKMSLYLSVGPIVFLLLLHEKTSGKFTDWWKTIAGCISEQVCMFAFLSFFSNVYYHILKGSMNFIYCWEPIIKIPILDITLFSMWKISGTMPAHMAELTGSLGEETAINTKGFNFLTAFMLFILTCMMSKFISKASSFGAKLFGQESSMPEQIKQVLDGVKKTVKDAPTKLVSKGYNAIKEKIEKKDKDDDEDGEEDRKP